MSPVCAWRCCRPWEEGVCARGEALCRLRDARAQNTPSARLARLSPPREWSVRKASAGTRPESIRNAGSAAFLSTQVLNGIAHDPQGDRLFVTGKCWPTLYQVSTD